MASVKYKVKKFDGRNSFSLWRIKMRALLMQQGLLKVLSGKGKLPEFMSDDEKEELEMKAHSAIQLCLAEKKFCGRLLMKITPPVCGSN